MNSFFEKALKTAARFGKTPGRFMLLLTQLGSKMKDVDWRKVKASDVKEKIFTLGRLIKAYASGAYHDIPWKTVVLITAAILYFVNPVDLIPDFLPITGFVDDFGILLWVHKTVSTEIDKFLTWEKSQQL